MKKTLFLFFLSFSFLFSNTLAEIRNSGILKIGVDVNNKPFSSLNDDNQFEGFEIDLSKKLSPLIFGNDTGNIEFIGVAFEDGPNYLKENKIDIFISLITINEKLKKEVDFSMPYLSVNMSILTRKEDNIKNMSDLKGKTFIVHKGSIIERYVKKRGEKFVTYVDQPSNGYKMLKSKVGDAFVEDNLINLSFPIVDNLVEVAIDSIGDSDFIGIAVQKGNADLLNSINKGLITLSKHGFFKKYFEEHLNTFYKGTADKKYFLFDDIYKIFD